MMTIRECFILVLVIVCSHGFSSHKPTSSKGRQDDDDTYFEIFSNGNEKNPHVHIFTKSFRKRPLWKPHIADMNAENSLHFSRNKNNRNLDDNEDAEEFVNRILYIGEEREDLSPIVQISNFVHKPCIDSQSDPFVFHSWDLLDKPTVIPGFVNMALNFTSSIDVDGPIKLNFDAYKEILGTFVRLPCFGGMGSCSFEDACKLSLFKGQCPKEFLDSKIPCTCPINKGEYASKDLKPFVTKTKSHQIPNWMTDGRYMAKITGSYQGRRLFCSDVDFTMEK